MSCGGFCFSPCAPMLWSVRMLYYFLWICPATITNSKNGKKFLSAPVSAGWSSYSWILCLFYSTKVTCTLALPIWHSGPILRVRNLGPESRVRNFSRPWENPLNQEFLPKPILLAQNLELGEFWGKNDGFKGKFLVLENFLGSGKIPDPRFQTQIPDPMVGSGMPDGQSLSLFTLGSALSAVSSHQIDIKRSAVSVSRCHFVSIFLT